MAGQQTPIISTDYNGLQERIDRVLGAGDGDYGYGQFVKSKPAASRTAIAAIQWNDLRTDLLKARQHQTGTNESTNLLEVVPGTEISNTIYDDFNSYISLVETNRLIIPPTGEATRENLVVGTRTTPWNTTLTHHVTVNFDTPDDMRWYFNTGSTLEISASRTGGTVNIKNNTWSTLLANMGTIKFMQTATSSTGSGTGSLIGYEDLTTTNQLVFKKLTGVQSYYSLNEYNIYARLGTTDAEIVFTIEFADLFAEQGDDNIDGTLISTVQVYRSSGTNVSVRRPAATSEFTGGDIVITPVDPPVEITYVISNNVSSIGEGSTAVTFTVTTTNVPNGTALCWTTNSSGSISVADFADNTLSGWITINNNTATIVRLAKADILTEGLESFYLELRTDSTSGPVVATSSAIIIQDLSKSPTPTPATYQVVQSASVITEGGISVTFTLNTTNVANGTTIYWTTNGSSSVNAADFTDNVTSGSIVINNNTGSVLRTATVDYVTEGYEYFNLEFRTGSTAGPVVAVSSGVSIIDGSQTPSGSLYVTPVGVDEGGQITLQFIASNVAAGTSFWLSTVSQANSSDFTFISGPQGEDRFEFSSSPVTWVYKITADRLTEGTEQAQWKLTTGGVNGPAFATSNTITINDTSRQPAPTYTILSSNNFIREQEVVTFTVTASGTNVDGTYYWANIGTSTAADFAGQENSGSFVISNNHGSITLSPIYDNKLEGNESIILQIRKDGAVVATSSEVTLADKIPPTYNIISSVTSINETAGVFTFTFTTTDSDGTYYWTNIGTATAADFVDGVNSGSFTVSNGTGVIYLAAKVDFLTEGPESVVIEIRNAPSGPVLRTSNAVSVNDTSLTPSGSASFGPGAHSFTIPANVYSLQFTSSGGGGGNGGRDSQGGGVGSSAKSVSGTLAVTPGSYLILYVGAAGANGSTGGSESGGHGGSSYGIGYNGGNGGSTGWHGVSGSGGGGGAASVITSSGTIQVVAGGGGGGGGGGQYDAGNPGILSPAGNLAYPGNGSAGKNCGWNDGGGGGGGGGGRNAGSGAIYDPPNYDFGGLGGNAGGSWIDGSVVSNVVYGTGSSRNLDGSISFTWG